MNRNGTATVHAAGAGRLDWVDYAKGICIVMVVMMHSVNGVESATGGTGYMHHVVEFARPFRMPDFFLISGLFLARVIDRDWRTYLDRKVVHFAYFYVIWVTIQFAFKAHGIAAEMGWAEVVRLYLLSYIDPFGTLWFIYMLPVFFVTIKATRALPPALIWIVGAALEMAHVSTGWTVIDEFAARFIYIYTGYLFAPYVFQLAGAVRKYPARALAGLAAWALVNGALTHYGHANLPVVSLALGLAGACAIVSVGTLLARRHWLDFFRYFGEHSIVIYLAFFLPMSTARVLLVKTGVIHDIGTMAAVVTLIGVTGAVAIWWACRNTRLNFLFERPDAFWIAPRNPAPRLQPAE
ncbi:MAG: acyltransferase family protein [Xanthobacteraceae bacterium]|nr:acyltransferase family protein [Xanthobacteraceae bacterium]